MALTSPRVFSVNVNPRLTNRPLSLFVQSSLTAKSDLVVGIVLDAEFTSSLPTSVTLGKLGRWSETSDSMSCQAMSCGGSPSKSTGIVGLFPNTS